MSVDLDTWTQVLAEEKEGIVLVQVRPGILRSKRASKYHTAAVPLLLDTLICTI